MEESYSDQNYLPTAVRIANEAGDILLSGFGRVQNAEFKGVINLVTEYDNKSEAHIIQQIGERFPHHNILTEEAGMLINDPANEFLWIIDPLDGTNNFFHGYPIFSVSIALKIRDQINLGVIYDPLRDELFSAEAGKSATLNGEPIRVSKTNDIDLSMLSTGFPFDVRTNQENNILQFSRMMMKCQEIRRSGSAALDLAWTGCGRLDGFWEIGLSPWDVAAGGVIVQEAGGRVTDLQYGEDWLEQGNIVASNACIHDSILDVLSA